MLSVIQAKINENLTQNITVSTLPQNRYDFIIETLRIKLKWTRKY